jgi:transposase
MFYIKQYATIFSKKGVAAMYLKITKAKQYEYIKLVESYWENGRSKQRMLYNFGRADLIKSDESFLRVVKRLCEIVKVPLSGSTEPENDILENCSEGTLHNYGYLAYLNLWRELGIDGCLEEAQHGSKITYSLPETTFLMVLQHLLEPMSKYATHENQNRYFNLPAIPLHRMYRALNRLSSQKEEIETGLFEYNYVRLNKTVDVVFYDVTTIHFESVHADELREFGYSKAGKYNEVQVVLGMIIDSDGMPVGYELFKGNTYEGKTMITTLGKIKKRFRISRVIIVADRGLNQKSNLKDIKEAGYGYIMAAKIKGASAALQKKVLADEGFVDILDKQGNLQLRYKTMEHKNIFKDEDNVPHTMNENMVVGYSPKRAKKDKSDRERLVEKANKLLEKPEQIKSTNKRGGRKYINKTSPDNETYELAKDKIEQDARFDGYYAIQTSEKSMSATKIMDAYRTLWKIEESFRIMKSTLEIRPVYHWSKPRIEGHFVVCFLAFLMERKMELLLKNELLDEDFEETMEKSSCSKIQKALNTMFLTAVTTSQGERFIKMRTEPLGAKIFKRLKLNMPDNISAKNDLLECFMLDAEPLPVQISFL